MATIIACLTLLFFGSRGFFPLWGKECEACERTEGMFAGYYWPESSSLPAWQLDKDEKVIASARSAESWPILTADKVCFENDWLWVSDNDQEFGGDFFFFRKNIVADPRLTETWQEIALGQRDPACGHNCLWEIITEATAAEEHPNLVHAIVDDMKAQGLLVKPVNQMTLEGIRKAMVEWSVPVWD